MLRRRAVYLLAALAFLPLFTGCEGSLFGRQEKAKASGYGAVVNGMNEKQVVKLLGEPTKRGNIRLEGNGPPATVLTYVGHNQLMYVTMINGAVIGKQRY